LGGLRLVFHAADTVMVFPPVRFTCWSQFCWYFPIPSTLLSWFDLICSFCQHFSVYPVSWCLEVVLESSVVLPVVEIRLCKFCSESLRFASWPRSRLKFSFSPPLFLLSRYSSRALSLATTAFFPIRY
jgi:hypothetical protein